MSVQAKPASRAGKDEGPMREETRQRRRAFDFLKVLLKFAFSQAGVILICIIYAVVGANIYLSMEVPAEEARYAEKREKASQILNDMDFLPKSWWKFIHHQRPEERYNETAFKERVEGDIRGLVLTIVEAASNLNYDGEIEGWTKDWYFPNALLFTITIITTIGYGHISPKTSDGQMFTIVYALIGMPLLVMFLNNVGEAMADGIKYSYSRICCRWCRVKRLVSERLPGASLRKARKLRDEVYGSETYMPTNQISIPIILSILCILGYLGLGSALFCQWEGWDLSSAMYFCFITLSTVGFGDMVPTKSFLGYEESLYGKFQMVVCVTYCMAGLALLAMCMSLIQEGLMIKAERMKNKMSGGKKMVTIDTINIRERASRDANGLFVGLSFDSVAEVESIATEGDDLDPVEDGDMSPPPPEQGEDVESTQDLPGQMEEESEEATEEPQVPEDLPEEDDVDM